MNNAHIESFIESFISEPSEFALFVAGKWGAGKTFIVKKSLSAVTRQYLYVSLSGVSSSKEIIQRLYAEAYPVLEDKTIKALGSIAKSIAGIFRLESNLTKQDLFELDRFKILVFDDLERADMAMKELLGLINNFVEHDDKHVIIIGNETELEKDATFITSKEKIIGFTLTVLPEPGPVILKTCKTMSRQLSSYIENRLEEITTLVTEFGTANLRVVSYALKDIKELYFQLEKSFISEDDKHLFIFPFLVLTMAYRMGEISRSDIQARTTDGFTRAFQQQRKKYEPTAIEVIDRKTNSIDLYTSMLDNEYLERKICDGFHDDELLARTISDFLGRNNPSENPEWRNLWYLIHQKEDVVKESIVRLIDKTEKRKYIKAGEILHVFGIYLRLVGAKLVPCKRSSLLSEFKRYINDIDKQGELPIWHDEHDVPIRMGSAFGLGFTSANDPLFSKAFNYLKEMSEKNKDSEIVREIEQRFSSDIIDADMLKAILLPSDYENNGHRKPYLARLNVKSVSDAIMRQEGDIRFEILYTIGSRYDQNPYPEVLEKEGPWVRKLVLALKQRSRSESAVEKFRLKEILSWRLDDVAQKFGPSKASG